jgi:hypothetical protein
MWQRTDVSRLRARRRRFGVALAFVSSMFAAAVAQAQSRCETYADQAVAAFEANGENGCGLVGPRWNPDREAHRIWCLTVPPDATDAETAARDRQLAQCQRGAAGIDCADDADRAEAREGEAAALGCTLSRPLAVGRGRAERIAWCAARPPQEVVREAEAREDELRQCRQASAGLSCAAYAQRAVLQHEEAGRLGCGFQGDAWNADPFAHRDWCERVRPAVTEGETARRDAALAECRFDARARSCPEFAASAVRAQAIATANGCGFSGPEWSSDAEGHRATCEAMEPSAAIAMTARRRDALLQCLDQVAFCEDHARHAVRQALEVNGRSCRVFGAEEAVDYQSLFSACRSGTRAQAEARERQRAERLALCR